VSASATVVNGTPKLHLTVKPSGPDTSLFAYLYDVDALGIGSLISHKPFTLRGATPGKHCRSTSGWRRRAWEVPAGHHLVLVIDTVDPRYLGQARSAPRSPSAHRRPTRPGSPIRSPVSAGGIHFYRALSGCEHVADQGSW
jgi:hypothetical protein